MKIFVAGGTGAIGRPLFAQLLAKGHTLVALTRSPEKAQALVEKASNLPSPMYLMATRSKGLSVALSRDRD